jgi:dihydroorotate dehydrogenase (fumarate)
MLKTNLGNMNFNTCLFNASGPLCTNKEELLKLFKCQNTAIVLTKSCTYEERIGNENPRYYENNYCTINSTGLANLGFQKYFEYGNLFKENYKYEKKYFVSVSGLSFDDNLNIIKTFENNININGIELNLSCPNIIGKSQLGYDFENCNELLRKIFESYDKYFNNQLFGLKLPPYFDSSHYDNIIDIIKNYPHIDFLTCINSLGNGLIIDYHNNSVTIKPKNGFGGIGGKSIKPIALANVHTFYKNLGNKLDIIGCGGIINGIDAYEHILCGAKMIQIGSQFMKEGINCFKRIEKELIDLMIKKNYNNINDFFGKLNYL